MEFHVIELPKLPAELTEGSNSIELRAKFINAEKEEEFNMIAEKDPYIKSAYSQLQVISQNRQKLLEYEAREKAIRDHNQFVFEAENRGRKLEAERINKLNSLLMELNRYDDLKRSFTDMTFQQQLLLEYGL